MGHILSQLTDWTGELTAGAAEGGVRIAIDGLSGTEVIEVGEQFTLENHRSVYIVNRQVTLSSGAEDIDFYPPLEAATLDSDDITFRKSSLTPEEENYLIRLVAARACISKSTLYYAQVNAAITQCTNAATAIGDVAALITLATTATTGDIAKGRASTVLGATAITALAAIIAKAEHDTTGFTKLGSTEIADALTVIGAASDEFDKIVAATTGPTALATSSLVTGLALVNTIPIGGGAAEYMGQAASNIGVAQGHALAGQTYLQEASAELNSAASYFQASSTELSTSGAKAQEAIANFSNAASHFNAATADFRAAGEKVNEAISNLRLVGSRLQVAQGGLRFEEFGRRELAQVESELRSHAGYPTSKRYMRE